MTIALAALAALLVVALVVREHAHDKAIANLVAEQSCRDTAAAIERGELLTRIQRPDLLPRSPGPVRQTAPEDRKPPPELHMVGRVAAPRPGEADDEQES